MLKQESDLENETNKILSDFEIQTDCPIPAKKLDIVLIRKSLVDFAIPTDQRLESEKIEKYLNLTRKLKRSVEHMGRWYTSNGP